MEKIKVEGWRLKTIIWLCEHIPLYRKWHYRRINHINKKLEEQGSPIRYAPYIMAEYVPTIGNCPSPSLLVNSRYALTDVSIGYYKPLQMVINDEIDKD